MFTHNPKVLSCADPAHPFSPVEPLIYDGGNVRVIGYAERGYLPPWVGRWEEFVESWWAAAVDAVGSRNGSEVARCLAHRRLKELCEAGTLDPRTLRDLWYVTRDDDAVTAAVALTL